MLPMLGAQVLSLARELESHPLQLRKVFTRHSLHAAPKTQCSQIIINQLISLKKGHGFGARQNTNS